MSAQKLVHIRWVDSCETNGWCQTEKIDKTLALCETTGWLVHSDKQVLMVASTRGLDTGNASGHITIPRRNVVKMKTIKEGWKS